VKPFEREGRASAVADESLDARTILGRDAHRGIDAESTGALPGAHVGGVALVEESLAAEIAEDAVLDDRLDLSDAIGRQVMGVVKSDLALVGRAEDAVEDDEVVSPPASGSELPPEPTLAAPMFRWSVAFPVTPVGYLKDWVFSRALFSS